MVTATRLKIKYKIKYIMGETEKSNVVYTANGKLKRTLDTGTFELPLTSEEIDYRKEIKKNNNKCLIGNIKCTSCGSSFKASRNKSLEVPKHPILRVPFCSICYNFYTNGEFSCDEDGDEIYCRWCGQGGDMYMCSKCTCGFCQPCIKKNFGVEELKKIENDDNWTCLLCDPKPLWFLRYQAEICSAKEDKEESENSRSDDANISESNKTSLKRKIDDSVHTPGDNEVNPVNTVIESTVKQPTKKAKLNLNDTTLLENILSESCTDADYLQNSEVSLVTKMSPKPDEQVITLDESGEDDGDDKDDDELRTSSQFQFGQIREAFGILKQLSGMGEESSTGARRHCQTKKFEKALIGSRNVMRIVTIIDKVNAILNAYTQENHNLLNEKCKKSKLPEQSS